MNMTYVILALTASYALVVSLLAYLVLLTNIHIVMKVFATVATVATIPLTFWGVGELRGMPSDGELPLSFRMLWAQMIEPNALQGEEGRVYVWLQALDTENFPVGPPRAYQLPYSDDLIIKVNDALGRISEGEEMQGTIDSDEVLPEATSEALAEAIDAEISETRPGGSSTAGQRISNFDPSMLSFDTEAAPITPSKPQ
ncbi:hypothetical protein [Maritimibacter sp. UBA3975]|uniref:hypothetical protein n=1 Tax=Maritimibacter sp. UBA3975 TaxID=1946833 RepID=UPI0025BD1162|nr:hypothetical protein [Maritimibacter sp. UBA3975]|tara:strand:+ start:6085 stop:6681 length:597 start_codon:yes stop_codon:yes gene_type:complete